MGSVPAAFPAEAALLPPAYRTVADEEADYQEALKRVHGQAFKDWPNEAGVSAVLRVIFVLHITANNVSSTAYVKSAAPSKSLSSGPSPPTPPATCTAPGPA